MAILSTQQALQSSYNAGFREDDLVSIVAIGMAESHLDTNAVGLNPPSSDCPNGSRDRGWLQINDCYHEDISDECAFNSECAAEEAFHKIYMLHGLTPWTTYNNGAYMNFVDIVRTIAQRMGLIGTVTVPQGDMVSMEVPASWVTEVSLKLGIADPTAPVNPPASDPARIYRIVAGDTLSGIAEKLTGDAGLWPQLYQANVDVIGHDPNIIQPDMVLQIPATWTLIG